jgi:hypothetical protein
MTTTSSVGLRSLTSAIRAASASTDDYKTELYVLVNYAAQVKAYQLPNLVNPDQWPGGAAAYQQTATSWQGLTGTLQGWALSTLKNVIELPPFLLQNSTQVVEPTLTAALGYTQVLIQDPSNTVARAALMTNLGLLSTNFTQYSGMTAPLVTSLESEADVFDANAQLMQTIAANALQTAGNDQQLIVQLNSQIDQLNNDIKALAVAIAGGSIATIAGLVMGIVGIVLAPATGGVSLALLVPAGVILAGGVAIIALDSVKIQQDKAAISALNDQINSALADITLVNVMSGTLSGFAAQVDSLKSALSVVVAPWEAAETYFTDTLATLSSIESPSTSDWTQVQAELTEISAEWAALMTTVQGLVLDPQVSPNAQIQLGMTSEQIEAAIGQAGTTSLITYLGAA